MGGVVCDHQRKTEGSRLLATEDRSSRIRMKGLRRFNLGLLVIGCLVNFALSNSVGDDLGMLRALLPETSDLEDKVRQDKYAERLPLPKLRKGCNATMTECRSPVPGLSLNCIEICRDKEVEPEMPVITGSCPSNCIDSLKKCVENRCKKVNLNSCDEGYAPQYDWKHVRTCSKTVSKECLKRMNQVCKMFGLSFSQCAPIVCKEEPVDHCTLNPVTVATMHHEQLTCQLMGRLDCTREDIDYCKASAVQPGACPDFCNLILANRSISFRNCKVKCERRPVCKKVPAVHCYKIAKEHKCYAKVPQYTYQLELAS